MSTAQKGDTVKVHYKGFFDDGQVFDSSAEREPLEFTIGENQVIAGFEKAVLGKAINDSISIRIPPEEGYGEYRDDLVFDVERDQFPSDIDPQIGMRLEVEAEGGQTMQFMIKEISAERVQLDANHAMAGQTLNFEITLTDIVKE